MCYNFPMLNPLEFHAMLVVSDYTASLYFYETLLGLHRVMTWDNGHGPGALLSLGPGRTLELRGLRPGADDLPPPSPTERLMLGIAVADAQAVHDALLAAGVTIVRKLKDNPWGDRSFAVRDPDGIRVWVYQITDPALAQNLGYGDMKPRTGGAAGGVKRVIVFWADGCYHPYQEFAIEVIWDDL